MIKDRAAHQMCYCLPFSSFPVVIQHTQTHTHSLIHFKPISRHTNHSLIACADFLGLLFNLLRLIMNCLIHFTRRCIMMMMADCCYICFPLKNTIGDRAAPSANQPYTVLFVQRIITSQRPLFYWQLKRLQSSRPPMCDGKTGSTQSLYPRNGICIN